MYFLLTAMFPGLFISPTQYDRSLVEISTLTVQNEPYGIVKLKRNGNRVKVKYFASKDYNGMPVGERYLRWAANKNIIAYSSGTYMNDCTASRASPVGLCIDQGKPVNENLMLHNLDGLVIVYATGGIVASNLKEGNLTVTYPDGRKLTLNLRNGPAYDLEEFKRWARDNEATVFQTHLFVYKNQLLVTDKAPDKVQERRFLAVCKAANGDIVHYVINLSTASSIRAGAQKAFSFLQDHEDIIDVTFLINLDTGCQDIFKLFDATGREYSNRYFQGNHRIDLSNASNILAYYYE